MPAAEEDESLLGHHADQGILGHSLSLNPHITITTGMASKSCRLAMRTSNIWATTRTKAWRCWALCRQRATRRCRGGWLVNFSFVAVLGGHLPVAAVPAACSYIVIRTRNQVCGRPVGIHAGCSMTKGRQRLKGRM